MTKLKLDGHINPTWTKADLEAVNFLFDQADDEFTRTHADAGHNPESFGLFAHTTGDYGLIPRWANDVKKQFALRKTVPVIQKFTPGKYLPIHRDYYENYIKLNGIKKTDKIYRIIIFLEDWQPGHILDINGTIYNSWRAGDYVGFYYDTPHAAYNLGITDRYTLVITGIADSK